MTPRSDVVVTLRQEEVARPWPRGLSSAREVLDHGEDELTCRVPAPRMLMSPAGVGDDMEDERRGEACMTEWSQASVRADAARSWHPTVALTAYGLATGTVTTAFGAFAAQRMTGVMQTLVWITVTILLAIGAVFAAERGITIFQRFLHWRYYR